VPATKGSELFGVIWRGPDTAVRLALVDKFGTSNCSNWALRRRKPHGDVRHDIAKITGIAVEAWLEPAK
jgi:hypothetical protein